MEGAKKHKGIVTGLVCLLVIVLIGLIIYQNHKIQKLSKGVNAAATEAGDSTDKKEKIDKGPNKSGSVAEKGTDEGDDLKYHLDAAEEELKAANEELSANASSKKEKSKNFLKLLKTLSQDPASKKMILENYKKLIDSAYGALFKELDLSPEELAKLKEMMADHMMSQLDVSQEFLGLIDPDETPTEAKKSELKQSLEAIQKRYEEAQRANNAELTELLGATNFQKYQTYEERLNERQMVTSFMESLGTEENITEEEQQDLIDSMYQARKDAYAEAGYDEKQIFAQMATNENRSSEIENKTYDAYMKVAGSTLSASQNEKFNAYIKQRRAMSELVKQMFMGDATENSEEKQSK